jgi:hypothetical protein
MICAQSAFQFTVFVRQWLGGLKKRSIADLVEALCDGFPAAARRAAAQHLYGRIDLVRFRSVLLGLIKTCSLLIVVLLSVLPGSFAAGQAADVPAWLTAHVGEGEGQIARVVLQRAHALYLQKVNAGAVKNPCYFAMDATRPHDLGDGRLGPRFYVICESDRSFRAISAGHGGGRNLAGIANFANGERCASVMRWILD